MRIHKRLTPVALGLCCLGVSCGVQAAAGQSDDARQGHDKQAAASSVAPAAEQGKQLQAITVLGELPSDYEVSNTSSIMGTDTPLIDTPFSVQVIPAKVLQDQDAQNLDDAVRNAPGVSVSPGEGNRDEFYIRGVKTKSDFFVDGMRDDSERHRPLYNVERVEVLQGPAALVFGRGGAGGAINLVTKKAERRNIRHLEVEGGSWDHYKAKLDLGAPIGDKGAFRLNAMGDSSDSFRDHYFQHFYAFNPTFHFDLDDKTNIDFGLDYEHDSREADRGIPSENGRPTKRVGRSAFFGNPDENRYHGRYTAGYFNLEHRIDDNLKVRNKFRISETKRDYTNLYPGSAVNPNGEISLKGYRHPSDRLTYIDRIELIGQFKTGALSHKLLTGAEYSWQRDNDVEYRPGKEKDIVDGSGHKILFPLDGPFPYVTMDTLNRNNHLVAQDVGLFAQDQIAWGEHWRAVVGLRWDEFRVHGSYHKSGESSRRTDRKFSPRAGLIYKPVENDSIYISASKSYTPAGSNLALSLHSASGANLAPQKAVNYEVGNKLDLFDGDLSITAAVFQLDLTNMEAKDPITGEPVNTGKQRNRGVELSVNGSLTRKWKVYANYTYLDAKIKKTTESAQAGSRVGLVPEHQFSVWSTYAIDKHWGVGAGVRGESRKYTSFDNEVTLPSYVVGDAMAYYQSGHYRVQVNVNNITDEKYYATAQGDNQIMYGTPRSVVASLSVDF